MTTIPFKLLLCLIFISMLGCNEKYTPKPYGYFRIDFPEKQWQSLPDSLPYLFNKAVMAQIEKDKEKDSERGWINLDYPQYNAKIHLSYKTINKANSLANYLNDCHHLAYTHTIKAESINEKYFNRNQIFGVVYYIEGNTATSTQFFVTDSTRHFLRGALYFNQHPDKDSLAPIINYLRQDIVKIMETVEFK